MELELSSSFLLLSFPPYFLLLCYPIFYTFVSSFGPSTSIHVTLSSSLPTFVSAHPFQKFYPTKKEAFFLRTFLSLVLKNFLIQKRREREFYGYNWKKGEEKISSFLERKTKHGIQSTCKFIKWMLSFIITIYRLFFFLIKNFSGKIFSNKKFQFRRLKDYGILYLFRFKNHCVFLNHGKFELGNFSIKHLVEND